MLNFAGPMGAAGAAGGGLLGALGQVLSPLDYPRQALYNGGRSLYHALSGEGTWDDALRAVPGMLGAGAVGALAATGAGLPAAILGGSLLGGAAQGIGKAADAPTFEAPEVRDLTGSDNGLLNFAVGAATDPLTYAGGALGRGAGRAVEQAALARGPQYGGGVEKLAEALGSGGRAGEMAQQLAHSPDAARVLSELPQGSSLLPGSNNALAFRTPAGDVARIAGGEALPASRAAIPEMLQPTRNVAAGNYRVERVPMAQDVGNPQLYAQSYQDLAGGIRSQGFHPADLAPQNVGTHNGQPVLFDPGAVVPHPRAPGPLPLAPEIQATQPGALMNFLLDRLGASQRLQSALGPAAAVSPVEARLARLLGAG